ncbi:uncharacterized protein A1O9_10711 [Exophiala aquamarina CBS 119918]|uniref:Uncharacterized protein n=1 Tax=Exophiala aquamarina CBS 119918 TaxID=1182545 RepID=A0A072P1Z9_9EURO|nr:uncharacterized protein A1O9_10711 [Exophiala aquamarina CBS 119918]KEF53263.1 hypothetical protein A1O9_10711 [Exophiala aquamarina CBS 119918]
MSRRYERMRETSFDLYTERDALPRYYRAVALVSTWLALGGYILFALAFTSAEENLKVGRKALVGVASTFLLVGYAVSGLSAFFSRSLMFTFDAVLIPTLTSSFMGVFVTVANHALHNDFPISNEVLVYVPLVTACIATIATTVISFITYRKISHIKSLDSQRRQHLKRWDRASSVSYGDATSTSELLPMNNIANSINLPEDEAQRRQLLRLLLSRETAESPGLTLTPSTYQITLPGDYPNSDGLQVAPVGQRPRAGSLPSTTTKFNILNKIGRDRSPTVESFKNPRERRRDEIERSSMLITPSSDTGWARTPGTSIHSHGSGYFNGSPHHV